MPKIEKIGNGMYRYKCTCGREVILHLDGGRKPDKLIKCWNCQNKIGPDFIDDIKKINRI